MSVSYFEDKTKQPLDSELETALGPTYPLFEKIFKYLADTYTDIRPEWKHYGKKMGWQLKIFKGKKKILFVVPFDKHFIVYFSFGDKAVLQVMESTVSDEVKTALQTHKSIWKGGE